MDFIATDEGSHAVSCQIQQSRSVVEEAEARRKAAVAGKTHGRPGVGLEQGPTCCSELLH